jgi:hypothetical protein
MSTRRLWLVLAFLLLLPGEVMAHRHRAGLIAIPYSRLFGSDFTGRSVSGDWPIKPKGQVSVIGAFSRYSGTEDGKDFTLLAYTAGVRYTRKYRDTGKFRGWSPFLQLLGGGVDAIQKIDHTGTSEHRTHAIVALGGGVSHQVPNWKSVSFQLQLDFVHRFNGKSGLAISAGFGWQFLDLCQCP